MSASTGKIPFDTATLRIPTLFFFPNFRVKILNSQGYALALGKRHTALDITYGIF
jgi:hypothetical protein